MAFSQYIYLSLLILCFFISLSQYVKYGQAYTYKVLFFLLGFGVFTEVIQFYMQETSNKNVGFIYHFYNPIEYILYAFLYLDFYISTKAKKTLLWSIPIYLIFAILGSLFVYGILDGKKDAHNHIIGDPLKVILPLYYLYELYNDDSQESVIILPMFWISVGTMFFFSLVAVFMSIRVELSSLDKELERTLHFWLNTVPNYVMYIMYSIGMLWHRQ